MSGFRTGKNTIHQIFTQEIQFWRVPLVTFSGLFSLDPSWPSSPWKNSVWVFFVAFSWFLRCFFVALIVGNFYAYSPQKSLLKYFFFPFPSCSAIWVSLKDCRTEKICNGASTICCQCCVAYCVILVQSWQILLAPGLAARDRLSSNTGDWKRSTLMLSSVVLLGY